MNTIVRWVSIKRKDIPCYSCGVEECKIQNNLMNNEKNWNYKLKKFKTVIKCSGYKEQLFDFNKEYWNSLYSFIYDWCDKYCGGKHNITQSNDGFDFMTTNITAGIFYNLVHRKKMNKLEEDGEQYINELERIKNEKNNY